METSDEMVFRTYIDLQGNEHRQQHTSLEDALANCFMSLLRGELRTTRIECGKTVFDESALCTYRWARINTGFLRPESHGMALLAMMVHSGAEVTGDVR